MKQTCILYGDPDGDRVLITNCVTEQFSQEAVLDPSGTDLMFHKFIVVVSGFVNGGDVLFSKDEANNVQAPFNSVAGGIGGGLTTATNTNDVGSPYDVAKQQVSFRSLLLEPRKSFEMRTGCDFQPANVNQLRGGTTLLKADPHPFVNSSLNKLMSPPNPSTFSAGGDPPVGTVGDVGDLGGYDLNNGPRCTRCDIVQIVGNQVFRIRVQFEICKLECDEHGQATHNTQGVLSNRWSVSDDIDENFFTTRRFSGTLRVATAQVNAHEFRSWVVPPLQAGFRRHSMAFRVAEDALTLAYDIVDRETVWAAPDPATRWHMKHSENTGFNGSQTMDVIVTLWGDREASQITLLKMALAICTTKAIPGKGTPPAMLPEISLTTESGTDEHSVTVSWRGLRGVRHAVVQPGAKLFINTVGLGLEAGFDTTDPNVQAIPKIANYDKSLSRGARPGEVVEYTGALSIAKAWRAYLQSPCDEDHAIDLTGDATPENENVPATAVTLAVVSPDAFAEEQSPFVNAEQVTNPYTVWDMVTRYDFGQNVIMLGVSQGVAGYISGAAVATATFGRLGPDTVTRSIDITAIRVGKEPAVPAIPPTYSYPINGSVLGTARLLDKKIETKPPDRASDGTQVFKTIVKLLYGLTHPPGAADALSIGTNAWEHTSIPKHTLTPSTAFTGKAID